MNAPAERRVAADGIMNAMFGTTGRTMWGGIERVGTSDGSREDRRNRGARDSEGTEAREVGDVSAW